MREFLYSMSLVVVWSSIAAGQSSVNFSVDTLQGVKPISRYIYGVNQPISGGLSGATMTRLGGNRWTAYNWETNASNAGSDYYFQNDDYLGGGNAPGGAISPTIQNASDHNAAVLITIPTAGYVSADKLGNHDVRYVNGDTRYPDPTYLQTRFKVSVAAKGSAFSLTPNTSDAYVYQDEFVNWVKTNYAYSQTDPNRPIWFSLDNEPDLWSSTHAEIHPSPATYAEIVQKTIDYGNAIKNVMPGTKIFGPVNYGFLGMWNLQNAPDANGRDFINYYLAQMKTAEQTYGKRLLDVLDVHWYPEVYVNGVRITDTVSDQRNSTAMVAARLQAPRSLWDPTYDEESWVTEPWFTNGPIKLLPTLQGKIDANYPGTKLSISEYNYGGGDHISGGIAEADVLGIFGRQGVFAACEWPSGNEPFIAAGFQMYRNFDGKNGTFGDTSVSAGTNDNAATSVYASLDSQDPNHMVLVAINKTDHAVNAQMNMNYTTPFILADVYQLTSAASNPTSAGSMLINDPTNFSYSMPAYSVSTINIRTATGLKRDLHWNQAGAGGTWDSTVANRPWLVSGQNAFFAAGDQVTFGDTGVGNIVIAASGVAPDTIHVQNTTGNYTFSGGSIGGVTKLEKTGAGTLTLANNDIYSGETSILGGVLALDAQGQISASSVITNNATFRIISGDHTVGTIAGSGSTEILSGILTVNSIVQNELTIGPGAMVIIAALPGGPAGGSLTPVPEPWTIGMLMAGILCLVGGRFFIRKRVWRAG
ncbi:MAG: glycoside hydrolase family 44 protein [Thermoguttaceae bacterium]|jgi:autotransporter-associated beta strand protein